MSLPTTTETAKAANSYKAVRDDIERARLLPWSSAVGIDIGGFTVAPLSFRSLVDLEIAGNSFVVGGTPLPGDIAAYLWRHQAEYKPSACSKSFVAKVADAKNVGELVSGIYAHIAVAFDDTPAASSFGGHASDNRLQPIPAIASICDEYGSAYGVDPQDVADYDLRIVFQCCRAQRIKQGAKYLEPKKAQKRKKRIFTSTWLKRKSKRVSD